MVIYVLSWQKHLVVLWLNRHLGQFGKKKSCDACGSFVWLLSRQLCFLFCFFVNQPRHVQCVCLVDCAMCIEGKLAVVRSVAVAVYVGIGYRWPVIFCDTWDMNHIYIVFYCIGATICIRWEIRFLLNAWFFMTLC